jgi:hypothetical protein
MYILTLILTQNPLQSRFGHTIESRRRFGAGLALELPVFCRQSGTGWRWSVASLAPVALVWRRFVNIAI